jgi:hypothetical protein
MGSACQQARFACITRNSFVWRQSFNEYDDETLRIEMNVCGK